MIIKRHTKKSTALSFFHLVLIVIGSVYYSAISANTTVFEFVSAEESYPYSVVKTGENYNFKFNKKPVDDMTKLKAGRHVLLSIYEDASINKTHSASYIRERARCHVFDSHFYTYSLCFLPNEFNQKQEDHLWGFVTQMPNWKWLATRFFIPALLAFALFFYISRRQN